MMKVNMFELYEFRSILEGVLEKVGQILENTKHPQLAEDVHHKYLDKFHLAEFLGGISISSLRTTIQFLGISKELCQKMQEQAKNKSITIRFKAMEKCSFEKKETIEKESRVQHVEETRRTRKVSKTIQKIDVFYWKFYYEYSLITFPGTNESDGVVLRSRTGSFVITTYTDKAPKPQTRIYDNIDMNLTWLFQSLNDNLSPKFSIERTSATCHTPRRNESVDKFFKFSADFYQWCENVCNHFSSSIFPVQQNTESIDLNCLNCSGIFVPSIPLFNEKSDDAMDEENLTLSGVDVEKLVAEEERQLMEKIGQLTTAFPREDGLITAAEGSIIISLSHVKSICEYFVNGVDYIEQMLKDQLISAIGKEITPKQFAEYMQYHCRKLFKDEYIPKIFSYSIRRPQHYPEGLISIEDSSNNPLPMIEKRIDNSGPMNFAINAATSVTFNGPKYVHAFVDHSFSNDSGSTLTLAARARQFSSFILVIGTIHSATSFNAQYAIIVQNKDDVLISLLKDTIPTPKAFKDAIASLSPEQQRFAKAFRSMQLESTLFGLVVIQIKPQLEKLLNLPSDSLTKEIKLTQSIMDLFMKYQVPCDLLSYKDGEGSSTPLSQVKGHVEQMEKMIEESKQRQLDDAEMVANYANPFGIPAPGASMKRKRRTATKKTARKSTGGKAPTFREEKSPSISYDENCDDDIEFDSTPRTEKTTESQPRRVEIPKQDGPLDFSKLPTTLDANLEQYDRSHSLHSTILKVGSYWTKKFQESLLSPMETVGLSSIQQKAEKNKAFDLLDALSRSGELEIDECEFHVVVAVTHCFDSALIETVIQQNVNPIEKIEQSILLIATTIHEQAPDALIRPERLASVKENAPHLFSD